MATIRYETELTNITRTRHTFNMEVVLGSCAWKFHETDFSSWPPQNIKINKYLLLKIISGMVVVLGVLNIISYSPPWHIFFCGYSHEERHKMSSLIWHSIRAEVGGLKINSYGPTFISQYCDFFPRGSHFL